MRSGGTGNNRGGSSYKTAAETAGKEESASGDVKTLDVVWFSDGKEGESFMRLAEEYMELHPDIKIELIEVPYADVDNKLKNMLNAGRTAGSGKTDQFRRSPESVNRLKRVRIGSGSL